MQATTQYRKMKVHIGRLLAHNFVSNEIKLLITRWISSFIWNLSTSSFFIVFISRIDPSKMPCILLIFSNRILWIKIKRKLQINWANWINFSNLIFVFKLPLITIHNVMEGIIEIQLCELFVPWQRFRVKFYRVI